MKTCKNCGATWPDDANYCKNCGTALKTSNQTVSSVSKPPKKEVVYVATPQQPQSNGSSSKIMALIIIIIVAAAAIIGAMFYISNKNQKYAEQLLKGDQYFRKQEYKKAIAAYNKAIDMRREDPRPYESKARVYFIEENYNKAIHTLNQVDVKNQTGSMQVTYANIKLAQGDTKGATTYYNKAVTMIPNQIEDTDDKTEQKRLINIYNDEVLPNADKITTEDRKTAEDMAEKYALQGVSNNNALFHFETNGGFIAAQGGSVAPVGNNIYYLSGSNIYKQDSNNKVTTIYKTSDSKKKLDNLNYYLGKLYFTQKTWSDTSEAGNVDIYSVDLTGENSKKLISLSDVVGSELMLYKNSMYLSECGLTKATLCSYNLDGKDKKIISSQTYENNYGYNFRDSESFAIINGKIYIPRNGENGIAYDIEDHSKEKLSFNMDSSVDYLEDFTVSGNKIYYYYTSSDDSSRICTYNTKNKKDEVLSFDNDSAEAYFRLIFAKDDNYYKDYQNEDNTILNYSTQIRDKNDKAIVTTSYDCERIAMVDDGFYMVDLNHKLHFYSLNGGLKSEPTPKPTPTSLDYWHVGTLLGLYWSPDWYKEWMSNGMMYCFENKSTLDDGENYNCITNNGGLNSYLYYYCTGDIVTYRYKDESDPDKNLAEAPYATKTVSLKRLIKDYYNTDEKKAEVDGYVKQMKENTERYEEENGY